jgi:xanthine dehydrogenase iron-sulfur-binding subunit
MNQSIHLTINRKARTLTVDVRQSLLEVLRDNLGLTGVKQGCGVGECGACTVLVDDEPVDACLFLAVWADGRTVRTVEGECIEGRLSSVQQAYLAEGAVQCGFCTPGLIMASTAFVEQNRNRTVSRDQIRQAHAGNICRCTGYHSVVNAVEQCLKSEES